VEECEVGATQSSVRLLEHNISNYIYFSFLCVTANFGGGCVLLSRQGDG
jgi:hypothetical protein